MNGIGELELRIKRYFKQSIIQFLKNDSNMDSSTSERAKVHRVAHYLENIIQDDELFNDYVVDCEYNRSYLDGKIDNKRLPDNFYNDVKHHNNTYMVDLIVHKRNSRNNLLYCEFKNDNESKLDEKKISLLTSDEYYLNYCIAATIVFNKLNLDNIDDEINFIENNKLCYLLKISVDEFIKLYDCRDFPILLHLCRGVKVYTLYDLYVLSVYDIKKIKNIGSIKVKYVKEFQKYIYENCEDIYRKIHEYDNLTLDDILYDLEIMVNSDELVEIDSSIYNTIYIRRSLLWEIFSLRLKGYDWQEISDRLKYNSIELRRIIKHLRYKFKNSGFNIAIERLKEKLFKFTFKYSYVYSFEELKYNTSSQIVKLLSFYNYINGCGWGDTIYKINNDELYKRYLKTGYDNICNEIKNNQYLSKGDKKFLINIVNGYEINNGGC